MKISRLLIICTQLSVAAPLAFSDNSDSCYYTSTVVCADKGTVLSSKAVQCRSGGRSATFYNQITTEAPTYRYVAVSGSDGGSSRQGKVQRSYDNIVTCTTTEIDPSTCNTTIKFRATVFLMTCPGEAADPKAKICQFALKSPSIKTDQALALLTQ